MSLAWVYVVPIGRPLVFEKVAISVPGSTEAISKVKLPSPTVTYPLHVTSYSPLSG